MAPLDDAVIEAAESAPVDPHDASNIGPPPNPTPEEQYPVGAMVAYFEYRPGNRLTALVGCEMFGGMVIGHEGSVVLIRRTRIGTTTLRYDLAREEERIAKPPKVRGRAEEVDGDEAGRDAQGAIRMSADYTDQELDDMEAGIFTDPNSGAECVLSTVFDGHGGVAVAMTVGDAPAIIIPIPALHSLHGFPWLPQDDLKALVVS